MPTEKTAFVPRFDHPWVREERAPIYVFDYAPTATLAEITVFYDQMAQWYRALSAPVACVAVVNNITHLDAAARQLVAARERELEPFQRKYLRGTAFIVESAMKRGLITAVFWMSPPCYRWKTFVKFDEGCFWAYAQLRREGNRPSIPSEDARKPEIDSPNPTK